MSRIEKMTPTQQTRHLLNQEIGRDIADHVGTILKLGEWMQLCAGCKQGERCGQCQDVYDVEGRVHGPDPQHPGSWEFWREKQK